MYPAHSIKGIISNDGSVVSNCISTSVAVGNIETSFSAMGDIANPGNDVSAETDHIPNNAHKEINPFPVLIFMTQLFNIHKA